MEYIYFVLERPYIDDLKGCFLSLVQTPPRFPLFLGQISFYPGNEHAGQISRGRVQRSHVQILCLPATDTGIYRRSRSYNNSTWLLRSLEKLISGAWVNFKPTKSLVLRKGKVADHLATVDKSGLPGKFKVWICQHAMLPRIMWPLRVY